MNSVAIIIDDRSWKKSAPINVTTDGWMELCSPTSCCKTVSPRRGRLLRQNLYLLTSKASKLSTWGAVFDAEVYGNNFESNSAAIYRVNWSYNHPARPDATRMLKGMRISHIWFARVTLIYYVLECWDVACCWLADFWQFLPNLRLA
jgi:hypothetical protein